MAPEVGLEPTTPRLTAACSTIELLWIPFLQQPSGHQRADNLQIDPHTVNICVRNYFHLSLDALIPVIYWRYVPTVIADVR